MAKKEKLSSLGKEVKQLQQPLGLKRLWSWLLFTPLLLAFLIIPLYAWKASDQVPLTEANPTTETRAQTAMLLDAAWNPGPVASSHAPWENDCQACHDGAFTRVQDTKCTACHTNMGEHVKPEALADMNFDEGRCASCHRDHKGRESLMVQNTHFVGQDCADCHQQIKQVAPKTETLAVSDFTGDNHPEFRVTVWDQPSQAQLLRLRLQKGIPLKEPTNLKFPHDVHLDPAGVEGPKSNVVMKCSNCHEAADTETGFKQISMEAHCQDCHSLAFEPALPERRVPHGDPQMALDTLVEFYSFMAQNPELKKRVVAGRATVTRRPGEDENKIRRFANVSLSPVKQAEFAAGELFEKSACAVCHEVTKKPQDAAKPNSPGKLLTQYAVLETNPTHAWMPMAEFDHAAHEFEKCGTCHEAKASKEASDVLMPGKAICQDCHAGTKPEPQKVQSDCAVCHGYHIHEQPKPKAADKTAMTN